MKLMSLLMVVALGISIGPIARAEGNKADLATKARDVLKEFCMPATKDRIQVGGGLMPQSTRR